MRGWWWRNSVRFRWRHVLVRWYQIHDNSSWSGGMNSLQCGRVRCVLEAIAWWSLKSVKFRKILVNYLYNWNSKETRLNLSNWIRTRVESKLVRRVSLYISKCLILTEFIELRFYFMFHLNSSRSFESFCFSSDFLQKIICRLSILLFIVSLTILCTVLSPVAT